MPRFTLRRTNESVLSHFAAARTPSPPATIRVEIAPEGRMPRASNSAPDELRTGPGVTAKTLIEAGLFAKRPAISNTEIGPAASSIWKSGYTRTPIMILASCLKMRELCHFGRKTILPGWRRQADLGDSRSCPRRFRLVFWYFPG